ncbi:hypothetical protein TESG_08477 [Trichophyton tonsurans CBS 112818]|uniref:Uncharacterized protein n=1 Tax=Trichophyton tonsurans (strain CBS 112818) TaxID=647933 RepID=F2S0H8_TRIT1|nr:hypothetical protein TESG_08477 [Trichophyton tonsurans CBS 112818]
MAERASDLCCSLGIIIIIIICWQGEVTLSLARIVSRTQPLAVRGGAGAGVAQSDKRKTLCELVEATGGRSGARSSVLTSSSSSAALQGWLVPLSPRVPEPRNEVTVRPSRLPALQDVCCVSKTVAYFIRGSVEERDDGDAYIVVAVDGGLPDVNNSIIVLLRERRQANSRDPASDLWPVAVSIALEMALSESQNRRIEE